MPNLIVLLLLTLAISCSDSSDDDQELNCGEGQSFTVGDSRLCIHSRTILEPGFMCPSQAPNRTNLGDAVICTAEASLTDLILLGIADTFPDLVFLPGGEPVHDPRNFYGNFDIQVDGRGAGTCQLGELAASPEQTWTYNAQGHPVSVTSTGTTLQSWTYNTHDWLQTHTKEGGVTTFTRDIFQRATKIVHSEGVDSVTWDILYEDDNRISEVTYTDSSGGTSTVLANYSADGLKRQDVFNTCGNRELTFDADRRLVRSDRTGCEAFGDPLTEYVYTNGRLTQMWSLSRTNGQRSGLLQEITYQNDVPVKVRVGANLNPPGEDPEGGRLEIAWASDRMTSFEQFRDRDDSSVGSSALTGECLFSVNDLRSSWTVFGSLLP